MSVYSQAIRALIMSTISFAVCFACLVTNAVLITYLVSTGTYDFETKSRSGGC
jgi:hypothetical protein